MAALILIGIGLMFGIKIVGGIIQGHADNLENPETRNFMVAVWLFIVLGIWCNMEDKGIGFALFAICAVPLILLNLYWFFTRDD